MKCEGSIGISPTLVARTGEPGPIGAALRQLYDEVAAEPIPDDFLRLLEAIDDKIEKGGL